MRVDPKTVSLSKVSDWMEQFAHVIRICGERYTPPHKWSHLRGSAKLWSASAVRDLSGLENPGPKLGPSTMCQGSWVLGKQCITSWLNPHGVVRCIKRTAANCTRLWRRLRVKREIIWQSGTASKHHPPSLCLLPSSSVPHSRKLNDLRALAPRGTCCRPLPRSKYRVL